MSATAYRQDPIAIVGIAGRVAGCDSPAELWNLLIEGRDVFTSSPPSDRPASTKWPEDVPRRAAYLDGVANFDTELFGISPREAESMDPQQRLMLEVVWELLEDSGTPAEALTGRPVGVYMGGLWHDYEVLRTALGLPVTQHSTVGNSLDILAARLSYFLRTRGPSLAVETSCSSSLVAVHLACSALSNGEIEEAIVGASNLVLTPQTSEGLSLFGGLSPSGQCRPFDARADGFVRGEGILAVHLKPLAQAVRDGDRIHACIHASGVNNDGGGDSLVTPSTEAQEELLREVYAALGSRADDLAYIEAHGTGTRRGDPAESAAVGRALGRPGGRLLGIGSIKSSIGHLEPAAGLAGLVKLVLSIQHGIVPATAHCEQLNPDIPFAELGLRVVTEPMDLQADPPPLVGVNSFGWGGTNAHVVLGPPPSKMIDPTQPADAARDNVVTLRFSAPSGRSLDDVVESWARYLDKVGDEGLPRVVEELKWHRSTLPERGAVVLGESQVRSKQPGTVVRQAWQAGTQGGTAGVLVRRGRVPLGTGTREHRRVAFVFPGQGAQAVAMAAGMHSVPAFRERLEECCEALTPWLDVDIRSALTDATDCDWLERVDVVQPALWAINTSLSAAWCAEGVLPDVVVGHSQGEIAAATVAGILSVEDAAMIVSKRSRVLRTIAGRGRMLAAQITPEQAREALMDFTGFVDLAVVNSPHACVLSGDGDAVLLLKEMFEVENVFCRLVNVDYASHSPHVDALIETILESIGDVTHRRGTVPMFSTVDLEEIDGTTLGPEYWTRNLRRPVLLSDAVEQLTRQGLTHAIEVSSHPGLTMALTESAPSDHELVVLPTLRHDAGSAADFAAAVANAWTTGLPARATRGKSVHRDPDAPGYPFRRRSFWFDTTQAQLAGATELPRSDRSGVVGRHTSTIPIGLGSMGWLRDHALGDDPVLPAAVSLALALDPPPIVDGAQPPIRELQVQLHDVEFPDPLVLDERPGLTSVVRTRHSEGVKVRVLSDAEGLQPAPCHLAARREEKIHARPGEMLLDSEASEESADQFYVRCEEHGVRYGPSFRVVTRIERRINGVTVHITLPPRAADFSTSIHPVLLDGVLQSALALDSDSPNVLPATAQLVRCWLDPSQPIRELVVHARRGENATVDLLALSPDGSTQIEVRGLELVPVTVPSGDELPSIRLVMAEWSDLDTDQTTHDVDTDPGAVTISGPGQHERAVTLACSIGCVAVIDAGHLTAQDAFADDSIVSDDVERVVILVGAGQQDLVVRLLQGLARRTVQTHVSIVVQGCIPCAPQCDPNTAGVLGLVTVAQTEHPQLRTRLLDLDQAAAESAIRIWWKDDADLAVIRDGRYARVVRRSGPVHTQDNLPTERVSGATPFRVVARRPGDVASVACEVIERMDRLPHGTVRVRVDSSSLNFIDVLKAAGAYPDTSDLTNEMLGLDASGIVAELGEGVDDVKVGDRVVCCTVGAMASELVVDRRFVRSVPSWMTMAQAAALPMVLVTAWHALVDLARVQKDELVLVHSGAGGLGLAVIQIAHLMGARVVATAGTPDKRAYLHALGIEACFDSRDLSWATHLRKLHPEGMDVVINSLPGEHLALGVDALGVGGRFIEVGKRDIYGGSALPLHSFSRMLTFAAVDIVGLMTTRPAQFARVLESVWTQVLAGALHPLPVVEYPFANSSKAFRQLASGSAIGKIALTDPASVRGHVHPRRAISAVTTGVHLITGGMGAMGLAVAEHLVSAGVRHLALLGRSAPSTDALSRIEDMRAIGAQLLVRNCDVGDRVAITETLDVIRRDLGSVTAVHHTAGVLDDATLDQIDTRSLGHVAHAKLTAALLLDELTRTDPIEVFVLFSSCAALLGSPGQAAYAAANAGLDALAYRRRHEGLPALSVMWPPVSGAGLGTRSGGADRLARMGWSCLDITEVGPVLDRLLEANEVCVAPMEVDLTRWSETYPAVATRVSWSEMDRSRPTGPSGDEHLSLLALGKDEQVAALLEQTVSLAARIIRIDAADIDPQVPLRSIGLDSLMTLELRAALENTLGVPLSPALLWKHATPYAVAIALSELLATSAADSTDER